MRTSALALGVALTIHSAGAIAILHVHLGDTRSEVLQRPVEVDVREPPPPPPNPPEPAPPPPEPVRPRIVARRLAVREPPRAPPSDTPPPPNQQPPPDAPRTVPPVFGVTMSSVVSGDAAMAVPLGNTTMTSNRSPRATPTPPQPYAGDGSKAFVPVPEIYIATFPRVLVEVNSADIYPVQARDLGIEGVVKLSVDIDEKGTVVAVRVVRQGGHGFDGPAVHALRRFRFSPALGSDGRAVPCRISFDYKFTIGD